MNLGSGSPTFNHRPTNHDDMTETPPSPPGTERDPIVEELHGTTVRDPYRWLEADDEERVEAWIDDQNEFADQILDDELISALSPRLEELARVTDYGVISPESGLYFQQIEGPDEDQPVLYVRDSIDAEPRELVNPNEFAGDTPSMDWYTVDSNATRLAYGYAEGGNEQYDVRVLDIDTGEQIDEVPETGRTSGFGLAWTEDGFYYVRTGGPGDGDQLDKSLWYHEIGTNPTADREITAAFDEHAWVSLDRDDTTGTVIVTVSYGTTHSELYVLDESAEDPLQPVITGYDASFEPMTDDGHLYIRTDFEAPRYRLLGTDLSAVTDTTEELNPAELTEVIPESTAVLQSVSVADDRLIVHHLRDASSELAVHSSEGDHLQDIDLPEFCTVSGVEGADETSEVFFSVQGFDRPSEVTHYDIETDERTVLSRPDVSIEADITVDQRFVSTEDGADVPAFVVHRSDLDLDGTNPAVVYGYGGFRISQTPTFDRFRAPFLEHGGVWVHACLRGGTEYGEPWHEAGMLDNKQRVFDDFDAVAREVCEAGYTSEDRLAAMGGSNGGLLVGAAITQHPDRWAAAFCSVPLLDMIRFHKFLLGESWTVEYGSPQDPDAFEWLYEYSPYHNAPETAYPATMFKTALGDTRVHPSHARKMTALLQERNTGSEPIILRTERDTGHGIGKPTSMVVREQAERWAFLFEHLGIEPS